MSLLEVIRLEKRFGGVRAVDAVGFSLDTGEFAALIGPNGAGKSTLFGLIAGQHRPDAGEVRLQGRAVTGLAPHVLAARGLARTFQTAAAFGSMTVRDNLRVALAAARGGHWQMLRPLWRRDGERADAALAQVGLLPLADRSAADLAYADMKRLELAIALAGRPRLLLMDEPTAGMAAGERAALMTLVRQVAAQDALTVLFTEHSMDVVFAHARRVLVLSRGKLIADGAPAAVRADPAAQAAYFGAAP